MTIINIILSLISNEKCSETCSCFDGKMKAWAAFEKLSWISLKKKD
jgi:hypothetical protein